MTTRICDYENNPITFALIKSVGVMVNATEMAKPFGKQVNEFMSNERTKAFVNEALKSENSSFLNIFSQNDLYYSTPKSGTYMHRILAIKFAAWLNPAFELWVYATIEHILYGKHVKRDTSLGESYQLSNEKKELATKEEKTVDDFNRYLEIEDLLKQEKVKRSLLTRETMTGMKDMFN